jgi:hypothetical protein
MSHKNIMTSGGYYVATHILTVWKRLAGLAPDRSHGWSFPDVSHLWLVSNEVAAIWDTSTVITHDRNVMRGGGGEGESDYSRTSLNPYL